MLTLGAGQYELIRSQSGFSVSLSPPQTARGPQAWQLDLHYVPTDRNPEPQPLWECEHLELCCQPFHYQTDDWRGLTHFGPADLDPILFNITLGNLLENQPTCTRHFVTPDEFTVQHLEGYRFRCQLEGRLHRDEECLALELDDEIHFAQATISVPVNAADPIATAQGLARRAIQLTEFAGSHLTRNDWRQTQGAAGPLEFAHRVTLYTPWRQQMASG